MTSSDETRPASELGRRQLLQGSLAAAAATALPALSAAGSSDEPPLRGRIRQSIVFWCFNSAGEKWDIERTCQVARQLGCVSVEICEPKTWPTLRRHGLTCAIAPNGGGFKKGFNNPAYRQELVTRTRDVIDSCAAAGVPSVISFVGYKWRNADDPTSGEIPLEEGIENCVVGLKEVAGYAERKGVTICVEHLNSRDHSHPMKGHFGYQGDDLDRVAEIIRRVGSPRVKLLFDIYHVQIMHGDLLRRLEQNKDILGHIHTAGNPGRGELDEHQEINYPPLMKKLLELGYTGYVGQEFIPTRAPLDGLRQAVRLCDV
ncbi:MAG TPA: TIM barrel protein [Planctomycetaceae bacterium]|jgi:sugar phosphate isomerase/epimerase|nr:TIM barrel protein [Planctomycetaceae bacterium]